VLVAALLVVAGAACSTKKDTGTTGQQPIVVGSTLSLTGAFAATGLIHKIAGEVHRPAQRRRGLLGRPVKWTVLDDQSDRPRWASSTSS
jgi:branched-chain amino acid transport system substrate-binding protein